MSAPPPPIATELSFKLHECDAVLTDEVLDAVAAALGVTARKPANLDVTIYEFPVGINALADAIAHAHAHAHTHTRTLTHDERVEMMESVRADALGVAVVVTNDIYSDRHVMFGDARAYLTIGDEWLLQVGYTSARCVYDREYIRERISDESHNTCVGVSTWMSASMRECLLSRDLRADVSRGRVIAFVTVQADADADDSDDDDDDSSTRGRETIPVAVDITDVFPRSARIINCAPLTYDSPIIVAVVAGTRPRVCVYSLCTDTMMTFRDWTHVRQCGRQLCVCDGETAMWLSAYEGVSHRGKYINDATVIRGEVLARACDYVHN